MPELYKGKQSFSVTGPIGVVINTDGPFTVYGLAGKTKEIIYGPLRS